MEPPSIRRTVTFPRDLFERIMRLAEAEHRTFANTAMYVLRKGFEKLEEEENA